MKIKSHEEYENTISTLEELGDREDFQEKIELIAEFEKLTGLIRAYEAEHFPIIEEKVINIK